MATTPCRSTNKAAYERYRTRQKAYGRWEPYVDAEPARAHVRALQAAGMGWRRIAAVAGLSTNVVSKLLYGCSPRGMAPSKRIRPDTAAKLLAVTVDLADHQTVDATGTRRRIHALVACGWSFAKLANKLGMTNTNLIALVDRPQVIVAKHRAVAELYEQLWNEEPPNSTHRDKISVNRARNMARREGWSLPMDWDEDTIDDPTATPHCSDVEDQAVDEVAVQRVMSGVTVESLTPAERREAARRLSAAGVATTQIARRLRCSNYKVQQLLEAS